jgi:hypothetical protein
MTHLYLDGADGDTVYVGSLSGRDRRERIEALRNAYQDGTYTRRDLEGLTENRPDVFMRDFQSGRYGGDEW